MKKKAERLCTAENAIIGGAALAMMLTMLSVAYAYAYQWVDGAWNAQVADVFARTGRYAVSYPHDEAFYVPITTGQTVLLPVALVFKLFGVAQGSAAVVPLLYMCAAMLTMLFAFSRFFSASGFGGARGALASGILTAFCFFSYSLYGRYAYQVLGEGAAMLFLILSCLLLARYARTGGKAAAVGCGAMLACALITKTVAVCFLIVFALLMLLECFVTRRFRASLLAYLFAGFAAAFAALDAMKFVQLGGGLVGYVEWWKDTLLYCFGLSSSQGEGLSFFARVTDNLSAAAELLAGGQIWALIVMLLLAPVCYLYSALARLMKKPDPFAHPARFALLAMGLGGDGFVVASVLFTSRDMFTERRVLLHGVFFLMFVLAASALLLAHALRKRRFLTTAAALVCAAAVLCAAPRALEGVDACVHYDQSDDAQRSRDVSAFSQAAAALEDARFYGCGWNFAAETMLLNGLTLCDLEYGAPEYDAAENHYLLVESYSLGRDLSADYRLTPVWQLRPGEETYTIYRIDPANIKE